MALADPNNPDPQHVWGKEPMPAADRQMSDTPDEKFVTYHENNMCSEVPPGLVRIHRTVARERDLRACPECVKTVMQGPDGEDDAGSGLFGGLL